MQFSHLNLSDYLDLTKESYIKLESFQRNDAANTAAKC